MMRAPIKRRPRWRLKAAIVAGASTLVWAMAPGGMAAAAEPKPPKEAPAPKPAAEPKDVPQGQVNKALAQDALDRAKGNASAIHKNADEARGLVGKAKSAAAHARDAANKADKIADQVSKLAGDLATQWVEVQTAVNTVTDGADAADDAATTAETAADAASAANDLINAYNDQAGDAVHVADDATRTADKDPTAVTIAQTQADTTDQLALDSSAKLDLVQTSTETALASQDDATTAQQTTQSSSTSSTTVIKNALKSTAYLHPIVVAPPPPPPPTDPPPVTGGGDSGGVDTGGNSGGGGGSGPNGGTDGSGGNGGNGGNSGNGGPVTGPIHHVPGPVVNPGTTHVTVIRVTAPRYTPAPAARSTGGVSPLTHVLGMTHTSSDPTSVPTAVTPDEPRPLPFGKIPAPGRQHAGGTITSIIPKAVSGGLGAVPILLLLLTVEMLVLGRRLARWHRRRNRATPTWTAPLVPSWN